MNWLAMFDYRDGQLYWRPRSPVMAGSEKESKRFNSRHAGRPAGSIHRAKRSNTDYIRVVCNRKWIMAHRIIWEMHNGALPEGVEIDHINGTGTDNRIENLRAVKQVENSKNKPVYKNNGSGAAGVNFNKKEGVWVARVSSVGKRIVVYRGKSKQAAVLARMEHEIKHGYHENHGRQPDAAAS